MNALSPRNSESAGSTRIFAPSSLNIDDSQLCFNKNHFSRPDFEVQRFMNLARRRAGLELIQKDLKLYLKSVQHSMIELINDDYADFVHLSSNLVSLQSSIDKIDRDIKSIWNEFEASTGDSVGTAEQVEVRCEQLTANRHCQAQLRDRIAFLSSLQLLASLLNGAPDIPSMIWLEKVASCIVDITSYKMEAIASGSKEQIAYQKVLFRLERVLCSEGVRSAGGDCQSLPIILSILNLARCTHSLTASLVADFLQPKLVVLKENQHELLTTVFDGIKTMRSQWQQKMGIRYTDYVQVFLDETLLTFIQTFIDKCLGTVAVPSDTRLFHRCFLTTQEFIEQWPVTPQTRPQLKAIRDKFNLVVYFKLETHKLSKQVDGALSPEAFKLEEEQIDDVDDEPLSCAVSLYIWRAIERVWSEDVFLSPLIDKLWDFTLRLLTKHFSWTRAMTEFFTDGGKIAEDVGLSGWQVLLRVRTDAKRLHQRVFDLALEKIWTRLRDMNVDASAFGQCLTRLGSMIDVECARIDETVQKLVLDQVAKDFDAVMDVPKQYRWTKKPLPTTPSAYVVAADEPLHKLRNELEAIGHPDIDKVTGRMLMLSFSHLVEKAREVLESVEATGSSLSRFKRKGAEGGLGATDDDKIKAQIYHDLCFCETKAKERELNVEGMSDLIKRAKVDSEKMTTWADIQRLAADLQRVQLSKAANKLSEANCVEVVTKLLERKAIDVIFTRDGQSYVTNKHLFTEVSNECLGLGGRAALTDMATALNLDFDHVERAAKTLANDPESGFVLSNGELFAYDYVNRLQSDLNELLREHGSRTFGALCKHWDISQELLQSLLIDRLSSDFSGVVEEDTIYTNDYLIHHKNVLRAVLTAITKPTVISSIQTRVGLPVKRFWVALTELLDVGEVSGRLTGSRTSPSCQFTPTLHDILVRRCAANTYLRDGWIALNTLKTLGLGVESKTVKEVVDDSQAEILNTVVISPTLKDQYTQTIDEELEKSGLCEVEKTVTSTVESGFDTEDYDAICAQIIKKNKSLRSANGFLFSSAMVGKALTSLGDFIEARSHKELDRLELLKKKHKAASTAQPSKKQEEADDDWGDSGKKGKKGKGGGKGAGGKGGAGNKGNKHQDDEKEAVVVAVSQEDVETALREMNVVPEEIVDVLVEDIIDQVKDRMRSRVTELATSQQTADAQSQKKTLQHHQQKAKQIYASFIMFENSSTSFSESLGGDLRVHLVRTAGAELATAVLSYSTGLENAEKLTEKQRDETIGELPAGPNEALRELYDAVKAGDVEALHKAVCSVSARAGCGLPLKRPDKEELSIAASQLEVELKEAVSTQTDGALVLLSCLLLLLVKSGRPVHASGKFVARLVQEMQGTVEESTLELLQSCQKAVVQCIKDKNDDVAKEMRDANIEKLRNVVLA